MQCGGGEGLLDGVSVVVCDDGGLGTTHVLLWERGGGEAVGEGEEGRRGEGGTSLNTLRTLLIAETNFSVLEAYFIWLVLILAIFLVKSTMQ